MMGLFPSHPGAAQLKLMDFDVSDSTVRLVGGSGSATNSVNKKLTKRKNFMRVRISSVC